MISTDVRDEISVLVEQLRALLDELAIRGLAGAGDDEIRRLARAAEELHRLGAAHLAGFFDQLVNVLQDGGHGIREHSGGKHSGEEHSGGEHSGGEHSGRSTSDVSTRGGALFRARTSLQLFESLTSYQVALSELGDLPGADDLSDPETRSAAESR